jgi:hypothetical protein
VLSVYAGTTDTPMLRRSPLAATMSPAESPHALAAAAVQMGLSADRAARLLRDEMGNLTKGDQE